MQKQSVPEACRAVCERACEDLRVLARQVREDGAKDDAAFLAVVQAAVACGVTPHILAAKTGYGEAAIYVLLEAAEIGVVPDLSWAKNNRDPSRRDARQCILAAIEFILFPGGFRMSTAA